MTYEMHRNPEYGVVRFNDAGRERFLVVRSGNTQAIVAEAVGFTTGVLIAEALNVDHNARHRVTFDGISPNGRVA